VEILKEITRREEERAQEITDKVKGKNYSNFGCIIRLL
jgi:hypothetical protein